MNNYKYFEQEGSIFHLKANNNTAKLRFVLCVAVTIALYVFLPKEKNLGLFLGLLFLAFALINLLKTTKKLTIDIGTKTVTGKHHSLSSEVSYRFEDFIRFNVDVHSTNFVKTNHVAYMVFDKNGEEKTITLLTTAFAAKPAQNIINEAAEIMGFVNDEY